jgi:hypothetical protein
MQTRLGAATGWVRWILGNSVVPAFIAMAVSFWIA